MPNINVQANYLFANNFSFTLIAGKKNQYCSLLHVKQKIEIAVTFYQISHKPQLQSRN